MRQQEPGVHFQEVQRFRQPWLWILLLGIALLFGYGIVRQLILGIPWGNNPMSDTGLVIVGLLLLGFIYFIYSLKMVTQVRDDSLYIHFFPLARETIPFAQIKRYEVRTYRPIREYGGWGIRFGFKGQAYNVQGNQGVQLELASRRRLLIGSQRPEELARAIAAHMEQ